MWQKLFLILISLYFLEGCSKNREFSETTVRIVGKISAEQSLVINGKGPDSAYFSKTFSPQGESYTTELPVGIWYFYGIYIDGQGNIKCGTTESNKSLDLQSQFEFIDLIFSDSNCERIEFNANNFKDSDENLRNLLLQSCQTLPLNSESTCNIGHPGSVKISIKRIELSTIDSPNISDNHLEIGCYEFDSYGIADVALELPIATKWDLPYFYYLQTFSDSSCIRPLRSYDFASTENYYSADEIKVSPEAYTTPSGEEKFVSSVFILNPKKENGEQCQSADQCESDHCNVSGVCDSISCTDSLLNGSESDVDCGGNCSGCGIGQSCSGHTDCSEEFYCISEICSAPSCDDGILNGDELGVDCGGNQCSDNPCGGAAACDYGSDCESGICENGSCAVGCNIISHKIELFDEITDWTINTNSTVNLTYPSLGTAISHPHAWGQTCVLNSNNNSGPYYGTAEDLFIARPGSNLKLKTAHAWCEIYKQVHLVNDIGFSESQLSNIDSIDASFYVKSTDNSGSVRDDYHYILEVLDNSRSPIYLSDVRNFTSSTAWSEVSEAHEFAANSPYEVKFFWGGIDTGNWAGYYGPILLAPRITLKGVSCPSCSDGVQNQDETDVDCGGSHCSSCP